MNTLETMNTLGTTQNAAENYTSQKQQSNVIIPTRKRI